MSKTSKCGTTSLVLFFSASKGSQQRDIWNGAGPGFGTSDKEFYVDFPSTGYK